MAICKQITASELKSLMEKDTVVIIDLREPAEYQREHISEAKSIPLSQFDPSALPPAPEQTVIFHCQSGNRTQQAASRLVQTPYAAHYILTGGLEAWKQAGGETVVDKQAPLPIMRQVQIVVGAMVLIGLLLGYLISPYFNWLSAIFAAGLLFSGITGSCSLARVLTWLPYNRSR